MNSTLKITKYLEKRGVSVVVKDREKQLAANISDSKKQKDLLLRIAIDLGYIE